MRHDVVIIFFAVSTHYGLFPRSNCMHVGSCYNEKNWRLNAANGPDMRARHPTACAHTGVRTCRCIPRLSPRALS